MKLGDAVASARVQKPVLSSDRSKRRFTTSGRGRDEVRCSATVATAEPRLITLSISPYNELARWSLAHAGIAYREEPKALAIHTFASRRAGGKGTTPVLVAGDEVVPESAEIAEWADRRASPERRLFPEG